MEDYFEGVIGKVDFSAFLLDFSLSFLLFAGALHVKLDHLRQVRRTVMSYALLGVVVSTFLVGAMIFAVFPWLGYELPFVTALLFGALISPTDPIAVLSILTKAGVPKKLETEIVGESLFNDGVGVVLFIGIAEIATLGIENVGVKEIGLLVLEEVGGGLLLGLSAGYVAFRLMKSVNDYVTEVLITLAVVMGGYTLARWLHFSGPLAMVAAGLLIGNTGRGLAMSDKTADYVDKFWELIDEILNAMLFVLIGLEIVLIPFENGYWLAGLLTIGIVLMARVIALAVPMFTLHRKRKGNGKILMLLTWGGLRGGISVALALSLSTKVAPEASSLLLSITYMVVLFSIVVQGLTLEPLIRRTNIRSLEL